ncbi:hypothetical protein [Neorhizobium sp. T25_13]|uniref:hypothetical protein n=1 Tax=Neorhizobium sp. T25_13 TaxID=2093830 RepID=UPI00155DF0D5|nr:hypothetical protein [Neorhizobium sp. T25_13]
MSFFILAFEGMEAATMPHPRTFMFIARRPGSCGDLAEILAKLDQLPCRAGSHEDRMQASVRRATDCPAAAIADDDPVGGEELEIDCRFRDPVSLRLMRGGPGC